MFPLTLCTEIILPKCGAWPTDLPAAQLPLHQGPVSPHERAVNIYHHDSVAVATSYASRAVQPLLPQPL